MILLLRRLVFEHKLDADDTYWTSDSTHEREDELWVLEKLLFENISLSLSEFGNIFDKNVWKIEVESQYVESKELRAREMTSWIIEV